MEHDPPSSATGASSAAERSTGGIGGLSATRRKFLAGAAAGTAVWAAPSIIKVSNAQAQGSVVTVSRTSSLWKWNAASPLPIDTCEVGASGNANRGSVVFVITCSPLPRTVSVIITVTSGPALSGTNARQTRLLQSTSAAAPGNCLTDVADLEDGSLGLYDSPNNTPVTLGPIALNPDATHLSLTMLQTGGGGTDTYTTNRVTPLCP